MMQEQSDSELSANRDTPLDAMRRARGEWTRLRQWLQSITPQMLARFLLVVAFLALLGWLVAQAWVALLPFVIGGAIAYALLPLVNRLDKFMPRLFAAFIALVPVAAFIALFIWLLIPISIQQFTRLVTTLPVDTDMQSLLAQARVYVASLSPNAPEMMDNLLAQAKAAFDTRSAEISKYAVNLLLTTTQGVFNTITFLLGFIIVPAWALTILNEQPNASRATRRTLPSWMRGDVWAALRILDRSLGWFLRGQVLIGIIAGTLVFVGLELLVRFVERPGNVSYQLLLALFAGFMYLIPFIGPIAGAIPGVLLGFSLSPQLGVGAIVVYIVVQLIMDNVFGAQIQRRIAGLNLNLLILVIVAMGALNFWLLLLAAPIAGIVYDLFRYAYGRFGEPPRPAGIIPSDAAWKNWNPSRVVAPRTRSALPMRHVGPIRSGEK